VIFAETFRYSSNQRGYSTRSVRAVSLADKQVRELFIPREAGRVKLVEWISNSTFVLAEISNQEGPYNLLRIDLERGEIDLLYEGGFIWASVDPQSGAVAFSVSFVGPELGLFVIPPGDSVPKPVDLHFEPFYSGLISWSSELQLFFAETDSGMVSFNLEGVLHHHYPEDHCLPEVSPDGRWLAFGACTQEFISSSTLRVYDQSNELEFELATGEVQDIIWRNDGRGFIYRDVGLPPNNYQVNVPEGTRTSVDLHEAYDLIPIPLSQVQSAAAPLELHGSFSAPLPPPSQDEPLTESGPWWIGEVNGRLAAVNGDGSGMVHLTSHRPWAPDIDFHTGKGISEDGKLAVRVSGAPARSAPEDLALLVLSLPDPEPVFEMTLFSSELQAGMGDVIGHPSPDGIQISGPRWEYEMVYQTVLAGNPVLAWSDDDRLLTFTAALDGPSSDLYLYDSVLEKATRLTREAENVSLLGWSPKGDRVVYATVSQPVISHGGISGFIVSGVHSIRPDGAQRRLLYQDGNIEIVLGWLSDQTFAVQSWSGGPKPPHRIRVVDVTDGRSLWSQEGEFFDTAVSSETGTLAFSGRLGHHEAGEGISPAVYLYELGEDQPRQVVLNGDSSRYAEQIAWSPELDLFLASSSAGVFCFTSSGQVQVLFQDEGELPNASTDGRWLAFDEQLWYDGRGVSGLRIYAAEGGPPRSITGDKVIKTVWSADGGILLYLEEIGVFTRLFSLQVPDGEPRMLHPDFVLEMPLRIQTE
jgi:hypothetical protein